ncbi:hypothetical protein V6V89_06660 [Micromonospora sp. CPCC 206061]
MSGFATALGRSGGMYRELGTHALKLMTLDLEKGYVEVADAPVVRALAGMFDRLWADGSIRGSRGYHPST